MKYSFGSEKSMDLVKVGKYIAQKRNEKNMTQAKLAEKLGVDRSIVSKWERSVSAPDITLLQDISEALDISLIELLDGQDSPNGNKKSDGDSVTIKAIDFYTKNVKKSFLKIFFFLLVFFLILYCLTVLVVNYNKLFIDDLSTISKDFELDGYEVFNKNKTLIFLNGINYNDIYVGTDKEISCDSINVKFKVNETILSEFEYKNNDDISFNDLLNDVSFSVNSDDVYEGGFDIDSSKIVIECKDEDVAKNVFDLKLVKKD